MNKSHYALVFILLGIALLVVSFSGSNATTSPLSNSTATKEAPAPIPATSNTDASAISQINFSIKDMNDKVRHSSEWHGKIIVVNFWATWCGPCRHEIPAFNALQKKYAHQNVQFLGLAYDDKAAIERFMSIIPIEYPVLYGDEEIIELSMEYGNIQSVLPYTMFVDSQGKVFHIVEGALSQEATERILAKVL